LRAIVFLSNSSLLKRILEKIEKLWENSPNLRFEQFIQNIFGSSLTEEACNGLTELGLLEKRTENEKSKEN